ncbi:MAG: oligosaccharide flippase family protein [Elusimicrobiota bacterium]
MGFGLAAASCRGGGTRAGGASVYFVENTGFRGVRWSDFDRVFRRILRIVRPKRSARGTPCTIISPLTLPPTATLFRLVNALFFVPRLLERLRRRGLGKSPIVIAYLPTDTTNRILEQTQPALTVYDCVDNFAGHPNAPKDLAQTEAELLRRADLVLTTSEFLQEDKSRQHPYVVRIHHGVSDAFFRQPRSVPAAFRRIAYFGTVWGALDYEPIRRLSRAGFEVTLMGPVKEPPPPLPENVRFVPAVPHEDLPDALASFDALLLPYADSEYNKGVIPAKIYECLATGKPILASPLRSLEAFGDLLYIAWTPVGFVRAAKGLPASESEDRVSRRIKEARRHSSKHQMALIEDAIVHAMKRPVRIGRPPPDWTSGLAGSLVRGFSWIAAFFLVARGMILLSQFFAARFLGPAQYGEAHLILAVAALLQILPMLGFPLALARFSSIEADEAGRRKTVSTLLLLFLMWAVFCCALFAAALPWLGRITHLKGPALALTLLYVFLSVVHLVSASALQGLRRFKRRGTAEALYGLATGAALLLHLFGGDRSYWVLIRSFSVGLTFAIAYELWSIRSYIRVALDRSLLPVTMPFVVLGVISTLSQGFIQAPGRIVLFHSHSAELAGIYSAYFTTTIQIALAIAFMASAVLVPLSSRPEGQREMWAILKRGGPWSATGLFAFFMSCVWVALSAIGRSYPFNWGWALAFSFAATIVFAHSVVSAVLSARDFQGLVVVACSSLIAGVSNLLLNIALVPGFGIAGGAISLDISYVLGISWLFWQGARHSPASERGEMIASDDRAAPGAA